MGAGAAESLGVLLAPERSGGAPAPAVDRELTGVAATERPVELSCPCLTASLSLWWIWADFSCSSSAHAWESAVGREWRGVPVGCLGLC